MKSAIFCLLLVALGEAPVARGDGYFSLGRCPTYTSPLTALTIASYAVAAPGTTWYEYSRLLGTLEVGKSCSNLVLTLGTSPAFTLVFKEYSELFDTYKTFTGSGSFATATPFSPQIVTLQRPDGSVVQKTYEVLSPDNALYFIIRECQNVLFGNLQRVWVFTTLRTPAASTVANIQTYIRAAGLPVAKVVRTSQNSCPP